jgi:fluoride exporter
MSVLVLTFFGSALGGLCRHWVAGWVATRQAGRFPLGTLVVNVSGAFLIGMVWAWPHAATNPVSPLARDAAMFGLLGGYTTVSTFTLQTLNLLHDRQRWLAAANIAGSFLLCLAAVAAGVASSTCLSGFCGGLGFGH